jgi:DNA ligase-1
MLNTPIKPMLLQPSATIPKDRNYISQIKLDGHRALLHYDNGKVTIFTRQGNNITWKYPELQHIELPVDNCILDGEMIAFDQGTTPPVPCFDSLMTRFQSTKQYVIKQLQQTLPVHFSAFDVLYVNNKPLINRDLAHRLDVLESIVTNTYFISICPTYSDGEMLFQKVMELGLEGIVSKNLSKPYYFNSRPMDVFMKIKNYQYALINVGAIRKEKFGWVMLKDGKYMGILEFVRPDERRAFYNISKQLIQGEDKEFIYLDPLIKCEVKYQSLSKNGLMRSASFERFVLP